MLCSLEGSCMSGDTMALHPVALERILKGGYRSDAKVGHTHLAQSAGKNFWRRASPLFWLQKVQLVVFVSAFAMVSTVLSVSCLLFFYSWCPRAQPFVKVGGHVPPCPMQSASRLASQTLWLIHLWDQRPMRERDMSTQPATAIGLWSLLFCFTYYLQCATTLPANTIHVLNLRFSVLNKCGT